MTVVKKKDLHTLEPLTDAPSLTNLSSLHFPESAEKSEKDEKLQPSKKQGFSFINSEKGRKQNQADSQSIENNESSQNINNFNNNNYNPSTFNNQNDQTINDQNEQVITNIKPTYEDEGYNPDLIRMEIMKNVDEKKEEIFSNVILNESSLEENKSSVQAERNEGGEEEGSKFGFLKKKKLGIDNKKEGEMRKEESEEVESLKENVICF